MRQPPHEGPGAPHPPQDHADDERPGRHPEPQRDAAEQRDRHQPQEHPERHACPDGEGVDLGDGALGVAEPVGGLLQLVAGDDRQHPVAELQDEVLAGQQVQVAALDAGDDALEAPGHVHLCDRAPGHPCRGDGQAPEVDGGAVLGQAVVEPGAQVVHGGLDGGRRPDDDDLVPGQQLLTGGHDPGLAVALQVGDADAALLEGLHLAQGHPLQEVDAGGGDAVGAGGPRVAPPGPGAPHDPGHDEDGDGDAHGVGQGVADGGLLGAGRLDGGVEHRRGQGPRVGAGVHGGAHAGQVGVEAARRAGDHERDDAQGHERQLPAQVAEEGVAGGQSHGVAEQGQAEAAQQGEVGAEPGVEGAHREAHEERPGGAEADRPERYLPDGGPQADDEEDGEDRRLRKDVEDGMEHGHDARVVAGPGHPEPRAPVSARARRRHARRRTAATGSTIQ